jgi:hypothetical protein
MVSERAEIKRKPPTCLRNGKGDIPSENWESLKLEFRQ